MALFRRHLTTPRPIRRSPPTSSRASHVMASTSTPSTTRSVSADTTSRWLSGGTEQGISRRCGPQKVQGGAGKNKEGRVRRAHDHTVKVGYGERFPQHRRHRRRHDDCPGNRRGDYVEVVAGRAKWHPDP